MADITAQMIKELRDATGAGMLDSKKALEENGGDMERSRDWLREKGITKAAERAGRHTGQGIVESYIHPPANQVGVLLELNSESDFVARNDIFKNLAHELAIQVAGMAPLYVKPEEVPQALVQRERLRSRASRRPSGRRSRRASSTLFIPRSACWSNPGPRTRSAR
jgi:elongation factor Ts